MSQRQTAIDLAPGHRQSVQTLLAHYLPATEVWAFGSRVKGSANKGSDLDLVAFACAEQKQAIAELREAFAESNLPFRVDLLIWDDIQARCKTEIEAQYMIFQSQKTADKAGSSQAAQSRGNQKHSLSEPQP